MSCGTITTTEYPNGFASTVVGGVTHTPINHGAGCAASAGVIRVKMRTPVHVRLPLLDESGGLVAPAPVQEASGSSSSSSSSGEPTLLPLVATFRARAAEFCRLTVDVAAVEAEEAGYYTASLPGVDVPGLYDASLTVYGADGEAVASTRYWLEVAARADYRSNGPLTIAEVRLELRDQCPGQNELLDRLQFTDEQMAYAIRKPVDEFNATGQPETSFTVVNFPGMYRAYWSIGACGYLLRIAAIANDRDGLNYTAGGVAIDDRMSRFVAELSGRLLDEWRSWMRSKKVELNVSQGWGSLGSDYGG